MILSQHYQYCLPKTYFSCSVEHSLIYIKPFHFSEVFLMKLRTNILHGIITTVPLLVADLVLLSGCIVNIQIYGYALCETEKTFVRKFHIPIYHDIFAMPVCSLLTLTFFSLCWTLLVKKVRRKIFCSHNIAFHGLVVAKRK